MSVWANLLHPALHRVPSSFLFLYTLYFFSPSTNSLGNFTRWTPSPRPLEERLWVCLKLNGSGLTTMSVWANFFITIHSLSEIIRYKPLPRPLEERVGLFEVERPRFNDYVCLDNLLHWALVIFLPFVLVQLPTNNEVLRKFTFSTSTRSTASWKTKGDWFKKLHARVEHIAIDTGRYP